MYDNFIPTTELRLKKCIVVTKFSSLCRFLYVNWALSELIIF